MILIWLLALAVFISFGLVVFRGAPYVPSHRREVERAFDELYPLGSKDMLVDFGSGDGLVLRAAARRGAQALGYELNPFLVAISRLLAWHQPHIKVQLTDAWLASLPVETTVVYIFPVSRDLPKLIKKLRAHARVTNRSVALICYGAQPEGLTPQAMKGAHSLYMITPLQPDEA